MVVHHNVTTLEDLCLECLTCLVTKFSLHTSKQIIKLVPDLEEECDISPIISKEVA